MQRGAGVAEPLLERREELGVLTGLLSDARAGRGGVVLVEGSAGIGKSSILGACRVAAERAAMSVLQVRGDDVLSESSFAAVRELFWSGVAGAGVSAFDGAARLAMPVFEGDPALGSDRDRASAVLHGLYWLTSDLAERNPLVLLVDDAQWVDAASARFLIYLARRIEALPVLLVVALRTGETARNGILGAELAQLAAGSLRPRSLSQAASGELVRAVLGPRADEELCRSCHEATRGNPFYLRELAGVLRAEHGRPTVEVAQRVRALGVGAIAANVLVRLARLGAECERLAEALAVLGPESSLRHAATLASVSPERARTSADALHAAELLSPGPALSFVHPIVHEAIVSQLPPLRRASLHSEAARMLFGEGAAVDRIAAHLLAADPYGEPWVIDALRGAARAALARGAPEAAASYLRRALAEPPSKDARLEVLVELGRAESLLPMAHDHDALREALTLASDPGRRAEIAIDLALALFGVLRSADAIAVLEDVLDSREELDPEMVDHLEELLIGGGMDELDATPRLLARAERHFVRARREKVVDPRMLATLAQTAALCGTSADEAADLARRAVADESLLFRWLDNGYVSASAALCWADRLEEAAVALDAGINEAQLRGSAPMLLQLSAVRADTALRAGDLDLAEDYARRADHLGRELGAQHVGILWLPIVLIERGRLDEAIDLIGAVDLPSVTNSFETNVIAHRGRVRVAHGIYEAGLADLLKVDRRSAAGGLPLSVLTDWTPAAAIALTRLGRTGEAQKLAGRELEDARGFQAPRRLGIALATAGILDPDVTGVARLRKAVDVLDRCGARLEHARALVNLGVALHGRGELEEGRKTLFYGLDEAHRCGGWALAEWARSELVAAGARPRRAALRGPDALTPAELRVARMAADGLSNREIAQALFVSTKTVEVHLSHAYAKLGIRSRAGLTAALHKPDGRAIGPNR